jgi:hypothetical protein
MVGAVPAKRRKLEGRAGIIEAVARAIDAREDRQARGYEIRTILNSHDACGEKRVVDAREPEVQMTIRLAARMHGCPARACRRTDQFLQREACARFGAASMLRSVRSNDPTVLPCLSTEREVVRPAPNGERRLLHAPGRVHWLRVPGWHESLPYFRQWPRTSKCLRASETA